MVPSCFRLRLLNETASTNEDAKFAAAAGEAEGLVIQALRQTAGKGRQGRSWESPEGNLYVSVLLRPRLDPQQTALFSFAAALAVHQAVREALPEAALALKWPNDVLVSDKKISGILLEAAPPENGLVDWLVVGAGINVAHHPETALYPTTSLAAEGAQVTAEKILEAFLEGLDHWRSTLSRDGFEPLRKAWLAHAKTGPMKVRLPQETLEGAFGGLDSHGNLILRLADGAERAIAAGDVFF